MQSKNSDEYQLEGKSGASSCGNSSSKSVYYHCCCLNTCSLPLGAGLLGGRCQGCLGCSSLCRSSLGCWAKPPVVCSCARPHNGARSAPAGSFLHWEPRRFIPLAHVWETCAAAHAVPRHCQPTTGAHRCRHHGKLSVLNASCYGWMPVHGMSKHRPSVALELCWPWSPPWAMWCMFRPEAGLGSSCWLRPALALCVTMDSQHASTGYDGTSQGGRYCNARGEILRPLQDQLQRRRSASACSSIKDESLGSEDDQTPS